MAENRESMKEKEIPVLTVLKNNSILKNIYVLNNPPSIEENSIQESEMEETLLVGRHPDCNIKLEHPSVSRLHLRIYSKPSSRSLFVTDLSSVHGTWISGKKAEPEVRIKLNEGDTLQLGGSTRLYRLHWIPLSRAYDVDNPFVPQLDLDTVVEETEEAMYQDENSWSTENGQVQTLSENIEGLEQLFSDENLCSSVLELSPSAPLMPEDLSIENGQVQTLNENIEGLEQLFSDENLCSSVPEPSPSAPLMPEDLYNSFCDKEVVESGSSGGIYNEENGISIAHPCHSDKENSTPRALFSSSVSLAASQMENMEISEMKSNLSIWSRRGKSKSVKIETSQSRGKSVKISPLVKSLVHENYKTEPVLEDHFVGPDLDEQLFTPDKENCSPRSFIARLLNKKGEEALKSESILNTPMSSLDLGEEEIFTPDKENMTPNTRLLRFIKNMGTLEEVKHPKSHRSSPLKRSVDCNMHKEEVTHLPSLQKETRHGKILQERKPTSSASKSHASMKKAPTVLKARADRDPFRPLPVNFSCRNEATSNPSVHQVTKRSGKSIKHPKPEEVIHPHNNTKGEENKLWTIVVDTASLLNEKSRKELQLLRGLKGTSLIVPRIVVRELDCMLKRGGFFRRMTEVSAALQWIEDCMANAKWWIHVQCSAEEGLLIPPTPPASPLWFSEDKGAFNIGSNSFSPYSLHEIVTPTSEDHILECALFFRRTRSNGQLVLLSNDVTLKIKAMAEGVICETAEEFRGSLVNPFSERFLYTDSSPRGATWSCIDDAVLKEKYYPSPSKKQSKSGEGARGLKLILLHNSSFRQSTTTFS